MIIEDCHPSDVSWDREVTLGTLHQVTGGIAGLRSVQPPNDLLIRGLHIIERL